MPNQSKDAIALLTADHQNVRKLFRNFEAAGPRAVRRKEDLFERIRRELEIHTQIEESVFYPAAKSAVRDLIAESIKEHDAIDHLLMQLGRMKPGDPRFDSIMKELVKNVEHHAGDEEEQKMFPRLKTMWERERLLDLGQQLARRKTELTRGRRATA